MSGGSLPSKERLRLLYVDPLSPLGHRMLNEVFIVALARRGFVVDIMLRESYLKGIETVAGGSRFSIPDSLYSDRPGRLRARLEQLRILALVRRVVSEGKYDAVFFSSFDEIALWASHLKGRFFLLAHSSVADLDHPLKRIFLKLLARRATFVVFNELIRSRCLEKGIDDVLVEPLGLGRPYDLGDARRRAVLSTVDDRFGTRRFRHLFLAPAGSKYGAQLLAAFAGDAVFQDFLRREQIALVLKDMTLQRDCANVVIIRRQLSDEQYQSLFLTCAAILLSYPESFRYRVSAVFFECVANAKRIILSDIPSFRAFEDHLTYQAYFSNRDELIARMSDAIAASSSSGGLFRFEERLVPTFEALAQLLSNRRD